MQDLFSIRDKVAVVTGGGQGIGLMIAQGFVVAGAKTYVSSRKADVIDGVAKELSKSGTCIAIPADLSTEAGCRELADEIGKREERLHILAGRARQSCTHPGLPGWAKPGPQTRRHVRLSRNI